MRERRAVGDLGLAEHVSKEVEALKVSLEGEGVVEGDLCLDEEF